MVSIFDSHPFSHNFTAKRGMWGACRGGWRLKTAENWALRLNYRWFYAKSWGGVTVVRMTSIHCVASTRGQTFVSEVLLHVIPRKVAVVTLICDEIFWNFAQCQGGYLSVQSESFRHFWPCACKSESLEHRAPGVTRNRARSVRNFWKPKQMKDKYPP